MVAQAEVQPTTAPVTEHSELGGLTNNNTLFFIIGIAVVVAAIVFLSDDGDDAVSV